MARFRSLSSAIVIVLTAIGTAHVAPVTAQDIGLPPWLPPPKAHVPADHVGVVDPSTGNWHLRGPDDDITSFYFGNPGDSPFMGDWDCDGSNTPGMYRQSDGFVYLRNSNTQGVADVSFYFGNPDDIPLAGDFNGDGCDTVSVFRPSEGRVFIINRLGADGGSLGKAEVSYYFAQPGDTVFTGDFDGDGVHTMGAFRSGRVFLRNAHGIGVADHAYDLGEASDEPVVGNWFVSLGAETVSVFRPSDASFHLRFSNSAGPFNKTFSFGEPGWLPVAGFFGRLRSIGEG